MPLPVTGAEGAIGVAEAALPVTPEGLAGGESGVIVPGLLPEAVVEGEAG